MATKSFLNIENEKAALEKLKPPRHRPDGDETKHGEFESRKFSQWLAEQLHKRLQAHPEWISAGPIALGSWARGDLCPKSDIDLLFCGREKSAGRVVATFAKEGLKIRSRVPLDREDWTQGVQPFDVLALLLARPLTEEAAIQLNEQRQKLSERNQDFRKNLLKAMASERESRAARYDSISNFLEPNLKFGPGGLRDLEQALVARELFIERFEAHHATHAFDVLRYYKEFFLLVRQKLHLSPGASDVLTAPEQKPISDWLAFLDPKDFMREIQKGVSRVSFYADWVIEHAIRPKTRLSKVSSRKLESVAELFCALEDDPSILMQHRVRLAADHVFANTSKKAVKSVRECDRLIGKYLSRFLDPSESEAAMIALFRSRLLDHCVPEFRHVVGHVQHDQYHRFSVDAHLLQVLRELKRLRQKPNTAGRLKSVIRNVSKKEWEVLSFAGLYHDIAKGRGGDHAHNGIAIARADLERFGKDAGFISDVCWLVEEHLALSAAAFRENPKSPRTWRSLVSKGVRGRRLSLLTVFTIADIRATNPDAWTPWKERLLYELVNQLEQPETNVMIRFAEVLQKSQIINWEPYLESLDPFLIGSVPVAALASDLESLLSQPNLADDPDVLPKVLRIRGGRQTWIRFHSKTDKPGLFLNYVHTLMRCGLRIRHASIHTDPSLGVYDWFEVKTEKTKAQLAKLLSSALGSAHQNAGGAKAAAGILSTRIFDQIEVVARDDREWVVSFRGRDQSGALVVAAQSLFQAGSTIHWAKVHTWGRQIDDVFGVSPVEGGVDEFVKKLHSLQGEG